ncbi:hypothetical protein TW95_gp1281 [Pandoravirus inopinatum]|uniref:Uncharacterized protein n=1 Tax=Pandoravirus inopinatum TaxID=1605721 RepID=A0A0B5J7W2_9VIRU|nr:hypothetical protein TW95_gp1281 [Pandoravirus inopinatum]AJF98015.1 hypothetical protein [Pandoravirus inopinatum]
MAWSASSRSRAPRAAFVCFFASQNNIFPCSSCFCCPFFLIPFDRCPRRSFFFVTDNSWANKDRHSWGNQRWRPQQAFLFLFIFRLFIFFSLLDLFSARWRNHRIEADTNVDRCRNKIGAGRLSVAACTGFSCLSSCLQKNKST